MPNRILYWAKPNIGKNIVVYTARDIYLLLYGGFTIINCYLYVLERMQDFSFVVMKNVFLIVLSLLFPTGVLAEPLQYKFASRDTCDLYLDVYLPDSADNKGVCILYAFGGGFREGSRRDAHTVAFMQRLADAGMVAVAMDYRLGFKGNMEEVSPVEMVRRFSNAVDMAVEDMFSALRFVYDSCGKWGADSSKIVLSGGSAGAAATSRVTQPSQCQYCRIRAAASASAAASGAPCSTNRTPGRSGSNPSDSVNDCTGGIRDWRRYSSRDCGMVFPFFISYKKIR